MLIEAPLLTTSPAAVTEEARRLEARGYAGAFSFDGPHDPFLPLAFAAVATERLRLSTAIAVAFARNPMLLAQIGNDLQVASKGRFVLGLGSQVRAHVEKRFGMPWSRPAARMAEMVRAIRAIWRCWNQREPLRFEGEFYRHTLMTPFFDPGPNPHGAPPIFLAGVGRRMTEVAGEEADGFFVHPFHTARSLATLTRPALEAGLARAGRTSGALEVVCQVMVVTGHDEAEWERSRAAIRAQIAFYASTPAYRCVLEAHGWGALQTDLNALSKAGRWAEMAERIPEEILGAIAVSAPPEALMPRLQERYAGFATRLHLVSPGTDLHFGGDGP